MRKISTVVLIGLAAASFGAAASAQDGALTAASGKPAVTSSGLGNQEVGMRLNSGGETGAAFATVDSKPRREGGFSTASAPSSGQDPMAGPLNAGMPRGGGLSTLTDSPDITRGMSVGGFARSEGGQGGTAPTTPPAQLTQSGALMLGVESGAAGDRSFAAGPLASGVKLGK